MIKAMNHPSALQRTILAISISAALGFISTVASAAEELPTIEVNDTSLDSVDTTYAEGQINTKTNVGLLGSQSIFDTPYSIISFTENLIENQQADTLEDLIVNDASTKLASSPNSIQEKISVRGLAMGDDGKELYDGMPGLSHPHRVSLNMVESVDIIKGASSLLTSTLGSPGGTINLAPKLPLDTSLTRLNTSYESDSVLGTHLDLSRITGEDDQFGIRFNAALQNGDGVVIDSEKELKEATLALQYQKDKLQIDFIYDYSEEDLTGISKDIRTDYVSSLPDPFDSTTSIVQPWEFSDSEFNRAYIKTQYELSDDWSIKGAYGVSEFSEYRIVTSAYLSDTSFFTGTALDDGDFYLVGAQYYQEVEKHSAQLALEGEFNTGNVPHKIAFDITQYSTEKSTNLDSSSTYLLSNIYDPVYYSYDDFGFDDDFEQSATIDSKITATSYAIADVIDLYDEKVLVTLGARYQQIDQIEYDDSGTQDSRYEESAITPTAAVVFKPVKNISLYANYIEALEEGEIVGSTYANADEILDPFVSTQIEFGMKWQLDRIGFTTSVFQIEKPSAFADDDNYYEENGEQTNKGIEVSAFGNLTQNIRLIGGVTYLDATLSKTENGSNDGNTATGTSEFSAVMGLEWDVPTVEQLTLTARVNHEGSSYANSANTIQVGSYEIYNVGARYVTSIANKDVTFRASIDNLLDEEYWITAVDYENIVSIGTARRFYLEAEIDF
jgi:iron complex outermembrane receptor protein